MNTFEKILALLRCELWGEQLACEVTADDIDGILAMAEDERRWTKDDGRRTKDERRKTEGRKTMDEGGRTKEDGR